MALGANRDQIVQLLQNIYDNSGEDDPNLNNAGCFLDIDDYDFGTNVIEISDDYDEDYDKLIELTEQLELIFKDKTDQFINTLFDDNEVNQDQLQTGSSSSLSSVVKLHFLEKIAKFLTNPNSNDPNFNFPDVIKSLPLHRITKLTQLFEHRLKDLYADSLVSPPDASKPLTIKDMLTQKVQSVIQRALSELNQISQERGNKEAPISSPELSKARNSPKTPDVLSRVLGIRKGNAPPLNISQSQNEVQEKLNQHLQKRPSLKDIQDQGLWKPAPIEAASPVVEKLSRFGRKITKQMLIDSGILLADQPENPLELKWQDIDTKSVDGSELISIHSGYCLELGKMYPLEFASATTLLYLQDAEKTIPFYENYFNQKEHFNFLGSVEGNTGCVCISVESVKDKDTARALVRTKNGEDRILIPASQKPKEIIKTLKAGYPEFERVKFAQIKDDKLQSELLSTEKKLMLKTYKFGVLYCKEGQTDEVDMFQNVSESEGFKEFLEFLGQRVKLQGWTSFRGGLDVKNNSTGTHSVYTVHRNHEIMFHVSTMLPFNQEDVQQLERKRHLGNDIIVIIYKEGDTPYSPTTIKSEFNHVFCVVQKEPSSPDSPTRYRIGFTSKAGVKPFNPLLIPGSYEKNDQLRDFLLTKLINAERMAFYAPDFAQKMVRTRKMLLENLVQTFVKSE